MPSLAALVTCYRGTNAPELRGALESLARQTRPADRILVIEDGPVSGEVREVVDEFLAEHSEATRVALSENRGLGLALRAGHEAAGTEFVANLDSDDLAEPERFERQLAYFAAHPELDVVGTAVQEFDGDRLPTGAESDPEALHRVAGQVRRLPESHEAIARYARINSPVNHPSVMVRAAAVAAAGGYRDVPLLEDYDLWVRMIARGSRFSNLPEPLTWLRVSDSQFQRRTGKKVRASERALQNTLVELGLVSRPRAILNLALRDGYRMLPEAALRRAYGLLFHRRDPRDV